MSLSMSATNVPPKNSSDCAQLWYRQIMIYIEEQAAYLRGPKHSEERDDIAVRNLKYCDEAPMSKGR